GENRSRRGRRGARQDPLAAAWKALRDHRADGAACSSARGTEPGMIRYALACGNGHAFESWFQNSAAFDRQVKRGLVTCPVCNSAKVEKALMAPRISGAKKRGDEPAA